MISTAIDDSALSFISDIVGYETFVLPQLLMINQTPPMRIYRTQSLSSPLEPIPFFAPTSYFHCASVAIPAGRHGDLCQRRAQSPS